MPRIFLPSIDFKGHTVSIAGEKAHYLTSVLRCKKDDELIVFNGKGRCLRTSIRKAGKREVTAEVLEEFPCDPESPLNIVLVQGLLKGEKMDLIVGKTTELGVKEIIPLITERSRLRETRKAMRWRKIAEEASRQSGRTEVPVVRDPVEFRKFIHASGPEQDTGGAHGAPQVRGFIFWEGKGVSLNEAVKNTFVSTHHPFSVSPLHLLVGPEGGFTREEVALAEGKGFQVVSLGRRILRAETAAISAVTLVQFLLGDMAEGR